MDPVQICGLRRREDPPAPLPENRHKAPSATRRLRLCRGSNAVPPPRRTAPERIGTLRACLSLVGAEAERLLPAPLCAKCSARYALAPIFAGAKEQIGRSPRRSGRNAPPATRRLRFRRGSIVATAPRVATLKRCGELRARLTLEETATPRWLPATRLTRGSACCAHTSLS